MQIDYTYDDIRKWLQHFRTLDYTKTKNRNALIDTFIYRVVLYDDKMKVLFNLKSGQKNELLFNLISPITPTLTAARTGAKAKTAQKKKKPTIRFLYPGVRIPLIWCGYRDLNPDGLPYAPQTYASACSAITANIYWIIILQI